MSKKLVLGVIGGGSTFTPELISMLDKRAEILGKVEVRLMDIDAEKLEIVRGLCDRILAKTSGSVTITVTPSLEETVSGADYVLLQFRQGGIDARIADEKLGLKYSLPFTETISVCGFSTFLRTYYEMERIAGVIKRLAPNAWVMNFTNPAGQLSEALYRLGVEKVIGVCNGPVGYLSEISKLAGIPEKELFMNWRGLNHLTFVDGVYHDGKNILGDILDKLGDGYLFHTILPTDLVRKLGFLPHYYLQYYYTSRSMVEKLKKQEHVRSELVKEIDKELLEIYKGVDYIPEELTKRGGYRYSEEVVEIITGIEGNLGNIHYAVVKNNGTLSSLPEDAFVEAPVLARREGVIPLQTGPLPEMTRSLVSAVKDYDRIAIDGAMTRDASLLFKSLMVHPLISCCEVAEPLLRDCLDLNREYIPDALK